MALRGVAIMATTTGATVIFLESHPAWIAAQQRARQRGEAMHRHPSFVSRRRTAAAGGGGGAAAVVRDFRVHSSADTPA